MAVGALLVNVRNLLLLFAHWWEVALLNATSQCMANLSPAVVLSGVCAPMGEGRLLLV